MKKKLLPAMKGLLEQGMKIQTMQAWGWYIRLIGPYAVKNRHLVNELLKIPEQTFPDSDPQVQIASQVAWEALIDALINPPIKDSETKTATEHSIQQVQTSTGINGELEAHGLAKSIKLIVTPLIGIMSSKCDLSVHLSCLNTWYYLLHKLDTSINSLSIIKTVLEPMFEVVFLLGPDSRNIWSWNFCLDLLNSFALARSKDVSNESDNNVSGQLSAKTPMIGPPAPGNCSWTHYPIEWMAWRLSHLDFFIWMIRILISHGLLETVSPEIKSLACNAALRIFRSTLKGVQNNLKSSSISYNEVMLCLNTIIMFLKKICEDADSEGSDVNNMCQTSLKFIEFTTEELEPSVLGSPLYKLKLDVKWQLGTS